MSRLPLAALCVVIVSGSVCSALTLNEISLMLRSGYSSDVVLKEIATQHFHGTLDAQAEQQLVRLRASVELIDALKNGKYVASESEVQAKQEAAERFEKARVLEADRINQEAADRQAVRNAPVLPKRPYTLKGPGSAGTPSPQAVVDRVAAADSAKRSAIVERKIYFKEHPGEKVAVKAARRERMAQAEAATPESNDEAREIRRKYEWAIQAHGNKPASSLSVPGTEFPQSDAAKRIKQRYDSAIKTAGDNPASTIRVSPGL